MVDFPRIRRERARLHRLFREKAEGQGAPAGEARLLYRRSPHEEYTFENGRILLNGMDLLSLVDGDPVDVELLVNLAGAMGDYRREVWSRYGTKYRDFNAQIQGLLERTMGKLAHSYEAMTGGVRLVLAAGRLWLNDIDPKMVLALFLSNPTEERRQYLKSIQTKLALILQGKIGRDHPHGVVDAVRKIFVQITQAMENTPPYPSPPLLASASAVDR